MISPRSDPASAPEVVNNPDYSRYPEAHVPQSYAPPESDASSSPPPLPRYAAAPLPISDSRAQELLFPQTSPVPAAGGSEKPTPTSPAPADRANEADNGKYVWGIPKRNFIILVSGIVFVIVALAVGVGVGVSVTNHNNANKAASHPVAATP